MHFLVIPKHKDWVISYINLRLRIGLLLFGYCGAKRIIDQRHCQRKKFFVHVLLQF
jgi:hypothetical protein